MNERTRGSIGLIVGNRGFFPERLVVEGRRAMLHVLEGSGYSVVCLRDDQGTKGSVENAQDAAECAALFRQHADSLLAVVVSLPNFGDERAVAETLRRAKLDVPVLIHAEPDDIGSMKMGERRDSFCGKISVCNNLSQYGIPFSLTTSHVVAADSEAFQHDLRRFILTAEVVRSFRGARIGAIGARPAAFNTVRFSEKLLEAGGVSAITVDLSDLFHVAREPDSNDPVLRGAIDRLHEYAPESSLGFGDDDHASVATFYEQQARLLAALEYYIQSEELTAVSLQCWTAMEEVFGISPCTAMSYLSDNGYPAACETDVMGALSMQLLHAATGTAPTILDWNNNYGNDPDACVVFHCGNLPKSAFRNMRLTEHPVLSASMDPRKTRGTCEGCMRSGDVTFLRISSDDSRGRLRAYLGSGSISTEKIESFGAVGIMRVERLQELMKTVCREGFEHHVSVSYGLVSDVIEDALSTYLGVETLSH